MFIYMTFYVLVPRLYVNSLLATLNARKGLLSALGGNGVAEAASSGSQAQNTIVLRPVVRNSRDTYGFDVRQPRPRDSILPTTFAVARSRIAEDGDHDGDGSMMKANVDCGSLDAMS